MLWHWDAVHQQAFTNVKATITKGVNLAFSDYPKGLEMYTDCSKFQLGAVRTQNNRSLAFFSRTPSPTQQKHHMKTRIIGNSRNM